MNKTVLITGSSSGIGKETAKYFQEKGWNVIATMRSPEKETELTKLDNVLVTKLDVLDLDSIKSSVVHGIEKFGKIDVLVNNAGYGAYGPLEAFERDQIIRQFNVNVIGLLDVTRALLPHFRENKSGIIINISSIGGKIGFPLGSLYHGTKYAVEGISESLSFELEEIGCKVKIVEPGIIKTDFGGRSLDTANDESLTGYQDLVEKLQKGFESMSQDASDPIVVAKVIYTAVTDGSDKLRYPAGDDANKLLKIRKITTDSFFRKMFKKNLGL